jgi:uncharacterized protein Usg
MQNAPRLLDLSLASHHGLLTAEILYGMPDYPDILQTLIWQTHDQSPTFPRLIKFVGFWMSEIKAPLISITVAHASLIKPHELRVVNGQILLN